MRKRLTHHTNHVAAVMAGALLLAGCGGSSEDTAGMPGESTPPPETPAPISLASGYFRDFSSTPNVSVLIADGMGPSLSETDAGITVTLAGVEVTFTDDDFGAVSWLPDGWFKGGQPNGDEAYLYHWDIGESYKHFDVWQYGLGPLDESGIPLRNNSWRFIVGDETTGPPPVAGSASYDGRVSARAYRKSVEPTESDPNPLYARSSQTIQYTGDFRMTAEFSGDGTTLAGRFENVRSRPGNGEYGQFMNGAMTFTAQTSGSRFQTTAVETTGPFADFQDMSIRGGAFGPGADEASGIFDGQNNDRILTGYFVAHRQPQSPSTQ